MEKERFTTPEETGVGLGDIEHQCPMPVI